MNEDAIKNRLNEAIRKKETVWISYHGGKDQLKPRQIIPLGFDEKNPNTVMAQCSASETKQFRFTTKKIMDIRSECWSLEESYPQLSSSQGKSEDSPNETETKEASQESNEPPIEAKESPSEPQESKENESNNSTSS
eukprot:TRINITY_DN1812_c0_g1_i1.p1 TRINITY_DN1812_c0_g1~~TRINITY_DN1812_c0_g1_i1.p1  ORF type:complete len:137 (+),score=50.45 TRINITY_DN1812_c0_g1_i1:478-888(+)